MTSACSNTHLDVTGLVLGDAVLGKGSRLCPITDKNGAAVFWRPQPFMDIAFEPVGYNDPDAVRVNLSLRPTQEVTDAVRQLDAYLIAYIAHHSERVLGKCMDEATVRDRYQSCLKSSERYPAPTLRCKLTHSGRGAVKIWNEAGLPRTAPDSWVYCGARVHLQLKSVYVMAGGKEFGPILEVRDVQLAEPEQACPFI